MRFPRSRPLLTSELTPLLLGVMLYLAHFAIVLRHAVNVPFWDEWDLWWTWEPGRLFQWLTRPHIEHRMVFSRLQFFLVDRWNGGDLRTMQALNFLLYGLTIVAAVRLARRVEKSAAVPWFSIFLFSASAWENHVWGAQAAYHYVILFMLLSCSVLFHPPQSMGRALVGSVLAVASAFSFACGLVSLVVIPACYFAYRTTQPGREKAKGSCFIVGVVCGLGILLWTYAVVSARSPNRLTYPSDMRFWKGFFELAAWGIGIDSHGAIVGGVVLAVVLLLFLRVLAKDRSAENWGIFAAYLCLVGMLSTIGVGRIAFSGANLYEPRYAELGLFQLPIIAALWCRSSREDAFTRRCGLVAGWLLLFGAFLGHWSVAPYREHQTRLKDGRVCLERAYRDHGIGHCPMIYPYPLAERLDRAREKNISFYRELMGQGISSESLSDFAGGK